MTGEDGFEDVARQRWKISRSVGMVVRTRSWLSITRGRAGMLRHDSTTWCINFITFTLDFQGGALGGGIGGAKCKQASEVQASLLFLLLLSVSFGSPCPVDLGPRRCDLSISTACDRVHARAT